jgi:hypothetical protein
MIHFKKSHFSFIFKRLTLTSASSRFGLSTKSLTSTLNDIIYYFAPLVVTVL